MSTNRYVKFNLDVNRPDIVPGLNFKKDEIIIMDPISIDKLLNAIPNAIEVSSEDPDTIDPSELDEVKTPAQIKKEEKAAAKALADAAKAAEAAPLKVTNLKADMSVEDPTGELSPAEYAEAKKSITEV